MATSSIFSNRVIINKPSNQTPTATCPLAIYTSNTSFPIFSSTVETTITGAKDYMSKATVTTDATNMLVMFGGPSGGNLMWYTRVGATYIKYQEYQDNTFFTGQHKTQPDNVDIKTNIDEYVGKIMSSNDTGYTSHDEKGNKIIGSEAIYITEALPNCSLSCKDNDPCVFGVLTNAPNGVLPDNPIFIHDSDNIFENSLYSSVRVNSLGEGAMWVSNINGPIKNGDWITSSRIPGIGKRQSDEFMHNYTVAKATMSCNFELNSEKYDSKIILFESNEYIMAYIGVTYHCG
jgi:hypothetical protein